MRPGHFRGLAMAALFAVSADSSVASAATQIKAWAKRTTTNLQVTDPSSPGQFRTGSGPLTVIAQIPNASVVCQIAEGSFTGAIVLSNDLGAFDPWAHCDGSFYQSLRIVPLTAALVGSTGTVQMNAPLGSANVRGLGYPSFYSVRIDAIINGLAGRVFTKGHTGQSAQASNPVPFTFGSELSVGWGVVAEVATIVGPSYGTVQNLDFSLSWNEISVRDSQGMLLSPGVHYLVEVDPTFPRATPGTMQTYPALPGPLPAPAPPPPTSGGPQFCTAVVGSSCSPAQGFRFSSCSYQDGVLVGGGPDCPINGRWFDPPAAFGFGFQGQNGTRFSAVLDFPTGFSAPFTVAVGSSVLGTFGPGQKVDFVALTGGSVSDFAVTGISPEVDSEDPQAFPIQLAFDSAQGDFDMFPLTVPEPRLGLMLGCGVIGLAGTRFVRERR